MKRLSAEEACVLRRIWIVLIVLCACSGSAGAAWGAGQVVTFQLVPSERWHPDDPAGMKPLSTGKVSLYREGSDVPGLVLDVGEGARVPPGKWTWVAESDEGYVSVDAGTVNIPDGDETLPPRLIYWPVEPACQIVLSSDRAWRGVQRLDVLSVSRSSVYPTDPSRRRDLWAPIGDLLGYGVGARGLLGISRLGTCSHREVLEIEPPSPPDAEHQELMVTVTLPDGAVAARDELELGLSRSGRSGRSGRSRSRGFLFDPDAAVWVEGRGTFFFFDVPAREELELRARHRALRTSTALLEPLGGSARELPAMHLKPRRDLELEVDYQPIRTHRRAEIEVYRCGMAPHLEMKPLSTCEPVGQAVPLTPGLRTYVLDQLDDGQYYLEAWVDDQMIPGVGVDLHPYLDPGSDEVPVLDRALLHELEVHGFLLLDGEPVPGTVELLPSVFRERALPVRRFRTGEDLRYHLYYFGRVPGVYETPPGYDGGGGVEDRLGLYADFVVTACSSEGYCRPFSPPSVFQGSGRFDLDLGRGTRVQIDVLDAVTGKPIPGARVFTRVPGNPFYFHHGELDWFETPGREGVYLVTDGRGTARLRWTGRDRVFLGVDHPGFERYTGALDVVLGEDNHLELALEPKKEGRAASHLRFPDGAPVEDAYLLVVGPDGVRNSHCSRPAGAHGAIDLPDECLAGSSVVVIAPGAVISPLEGAALPSFPEVSIPRAPARPLRVRVVDDDGHGVGGASIALRYGRIVLTANDLLLAATYTGHQLFYLTDSAGEITLRGVDPEAVPVPEVAVPAGDETAWLSLNGYLRGETVVITVQ